MSERPMINEIIDDLIDEWNESDTEVSLVDFLGVPREQYSLWVEGKLSSEELASFSDLIIFAIWVKTCLTA